MTGGGTVAMLDSSVDDGDRDGGGKGNFFLRGR
jgi:hypothetical protein